MLVGNVENSLIGEYCKHKLQQHALDYSDQYEYNRVLVLYTTNVRTYIFRFSRQKRCVPLFKKKTFACLFWTRYSICSYNHKLFPTAIKLAESLYLSTQPSVFPDIQGWLVAGNVIITINSANALMIVNMYQIVNPISHLTRALQPFCVEIQFLSSQCMTEHQYEYQLNMCCSLCLGKKVGTRHLTNLCLEERLQSVGLV